MGKVAGCELVCFPTLATNTNTSQGWGFAQSGFDGEEGEAVGDDLNLIAARRGHLRAELAQIAGDGLNCWVRTGELDGSESLGDAAAAGVVDNAGEDERWIGK